MGEKGKRRRLEVPQSSDNTNSRTNHQASSQASPSGTNNPYLAHHNTSNPWTGEPYSRRYYDILAVREKLPVHDSREKLLNLLKTNRVVVLEGETGSGKTTQVPQFLVEAGYVKDGQKIACTQPRRVAAMSVAKRVADEMDVRLGTQVGYTIRFEDRTSESTVLKYMTDGMLLREAMHDPQLKSYSALVLDEAHERTLSTDVLMGLLKDVMKKREDLRVIVMSATMDAQRFQEYFNNAPLLSVPGRMFNVEIFYSSTWEEDYVVAAIRTAVDICKNEPPGDVLVFLTGELEIEESVKKIEDQTRGSPNGPVKVYPLYGSLPPHKQQKVFELPPPPSRPGGPPGRKVICATNIAETSLTIDGVVYVVDPGFSKQKIYNPRSRMETLLIQPISKASAKQRAGRAGRTKPGKCYRLYTKESFNEDLVEVSYPEILRSNLGSVALQLMKLGITDLVHFDFMSPPAPETLMRGLEILHYLGALDDEGNLTEVGNLMAEFPLGPEEAAVLVNSPKHKCSEEIVTILAMLSSAQNYFYQPRKKDTRGRKSMNPRKRFDHKDGDHLTLLNIYHAYKEAENNGELQEWCYHNYVNERALKTADSIRNQLVKMMRKLNIHLISIDINDRKYSKEIRKALLSGFFMQIGHRSDKGKRYMTVKDQQMAVLHSQTSLRYSPEWVMFHEFIVTEQKEALRTCSEVEGIWLIEEARHYYDLSNFPNGSTLDELRRLYDRKKRRDERQIA